MAKITAYTDKYTPEDAAKRHFVMKDIWKNGKVICKFEVGTNKISDEQDKICGKKFYAESNSYQTHLLFEHFVFRGTCSTKMAKKIESDCIEGFAKRPEILRIKKELKKGLKERRFKVIYLFRSFWNNIETGLKIK